MDIRSFFQRKPAPSAASKKGKEPSASSSSKIAVSGAAGASSSAKKPRSNASSASAAGSSSSKPPARKAKSRARNVVVIDSDEDEDVEVMEESDHVKAQPRKRLRRGDEPSSAASASCTAIPAKTPSKPPASATKASDQQSSKPKVEPEEPKDSEEQDSLTAPPPQLAGKPPAGCSGCLEGKSFSFSGVLHEMSRLDAEQLVKICGGSVSNQVSRNTKYLVVGHSLENGGNVTESSKYKTALQHNVRILSQNDFYNLISEATTAQQQRQKHQMQKQSKARAPGKAKASSSSSSSSVPEALWVDKYKPQKMDDMIGNVQLAVKLKQWLLDFDAVHVKKTKRVPFNGANPAENRGAKTVLLSGPPGIGKTTLANLVVNDCGFEKTEFNASDVRSKKMLQSGLQDVVGMHALQFQPIKSSKDNKDNNMRLNKRVVIMDEVDGMSSGDRGGIAELIQLIKKSKTPIICICNDRQSPKVRSLANHAYDLRMKRPTKIQIGKRLMEIGSYEHLSIEKNAIEEAAERCGNDIRQLLTQMQKWKLTTDRVTYSDLISGSGHDKDEVLRLNPFSATQQIFDRGSTFERRNEAYFVDYDMMPLMVQENYLSSIMSNRLSSDEKLELAAVAADFIAESDIVSKYVRQDQRWDLLTKQAALNVAACIHAKGFVGRTEFSKWLGKNSSANKSKRLLSELSVRMRSHASGSREVIRMDYVPYMKEILLTRLLSGEEQIDQVIELLDACEITREDLTESMECFKFPGIKRHSYTQLDTKAKTAFTRKYNKVVHKSQAIVGATLGTVKKGKATKAAAVADDDGIGAPSDAESEPEQDEDDNDVSAFQKKPKAARGGKSATSTPRTKRKAAAGDKASSTPKKKRRG